jgi:hypothetical protein
MGLMRQASRALRNAKAAKIAKKSCLCGLGALCVLVVGLAAQAPPSDAAATVLAATRQALGGEQKLAAVKTVLATGRTRQVRGENLVPIEFEIAMELPERYVRKDEIPAQESGPTLSGFNGADLIQFPAPGAPAGRGRDGAPPAPPTPEQMEAARRTRLAAVKQDFVRLTLGMFATSYSSAPLTFSYVAKAEAPEGKADVLAISGPDGFSARLFINAETHLPIMMTWTQAGGPQRGRGGPPAPPGGPAASAGQAAPGREGGPPPGATPPQARGDAPVTPQRGSEPGRGGGPPPPPESRLFYADYRDVSGVKLPFRLRRALGPDTIEETTFDNFRINPKIDPKKFEIKK